MFLLNPLLRERLYTGSATVTCRVCSRSRRLAITSATIQAAPATARLIALPAHARCAFGVATTAGTHTKAPKPRIIAVSKRPARTAWMPVTMAMPASKWPMPVANAQNRWLGGIHFGTMLMVSGSDKKCAKPNVIAQSPNRTRQT